MGSCFGCVGFPARRCEGGRDGLLLAPKTTLSRRKAVRHPSFPCQNFPEFRLSLKALRVRRILGADKSRNSAGGRGVCARGGALRADDQRVPARPAGRPRAGVGAGAGGGTVGGNKRFGRAIGGAGGTERETSGAALGEALIEKSSRFYVYCYPRILCARGARAFWGKAPTRPRPKNVFLSSARSGGPPESAHEGGTPSSR